METTVNERQPVPAEREVLRFVRLCLRGRWEPEALEAAGRLATQAELDWAALVQVADAEPLWHPAPAAGTAVLSLPLVGGVERGL